MGDEGAVMELLLDMMSCFEDGSRCPDSEAELSRKRPCERGLPESDQCSRWSSCAAPSSDLPEGAPSGAWPTPGRVSPPLAGLASSFSVVAPARGHNTQLCRRLSLATACKLSALDDEERLMRGERCLRRHVLLRNMSVCLQQAARDETHARRVSMATDSQWRQRRKQRWLQRSSSLSADDESSATAATSISPAFSSSLPPSTLPLIDNVSSFTPCRRAYRADLEPHVCVDDDMSSLLECESRDCDISNLDYPDCSPRPKRLCISSKSCQQEALESDVSQDDLKSALKTGRSSSAFSEVQQVSQHWLFTME